MFNAIDQFCISNHRYAKLIHIQRLKPFKNLYRLFPYNIAANISIKHILNHLKISLSSKSKSLLPIIKSGDVFLSDRKKSSQESGLLDKITSDPIFLI